ncbi:MAG: S-adenosylmethionine:tRNA ribosyltransferase-isomerase, partial [Alphaproteobacteria bacterium]|nr:S-adenosylmethionine:tRNA ribosyltransferase-isomerase [Alphaproteobacteria bacterium]
PVPLTLHVGAGTFLPVKVDDIAEHKMHAEYGEITEATARVVNQARASGGRVVAVGTTVLRLLESAADGDGILHPFAGDTDIFITPGYRFKIVDLLMTNFHLPKSTLFMLVCAFGGMARMKAAYAHAIATGYRFYSYGDGSLLKRAE